MSREEYAVGENWGLPFVTVLLILGLLSVVAIPRYMDLRRENQREAEEVAAHGYIRSLHSALTVHIANHHLTGAEWVEDGEALMALLEEGREMPPGMRYADNLWTDEKTGLQWELKKASGRLPPRIRRVLERLPSDAWEMEPIGRVPQRSIPRS
jgi:type II secretory pathway pseudopilin PulG